MKNALLLAASIGIALAAGCSRPSGTDLPALPDGYVRESELPAGELEGLTENQKHRVLVAMNEVADACGPEGRTYASCRAKYPDRPRSARAFDEAKRLARLGKNADEIAAAVRRLPTAATAPMPAVRLRDGAPVVEKEIHVHPGAEGNH
jgi:hypothetical protein